MAIRNRVTYSRDDIAAHIAHVEGISKEQATRILKTAINAIIVALANGYTVNLNGLLRLTGVYSKSRQGYHPLEQCNISIPATVRVRASFSDNLMSILRSKVDFFEMLEKCDGKIKAPAEFLKDMINSEDAPMH